MQRSPSARTRTRRTGGEATAIASFWTALADDAHLVAVGSGSFGAATPAPAATPKTRSGHRSAHRRVGPPPRARTRQPHAPDAQRHTNDENGHALQASR